MNEHSTPMIQLQALPDGEAELRLVVRLRWEDVAALGQEAGQLATQFQRPVSLDEAASHRLASRIAHAKQNASRHAAGQGQGQSPSDQARQAIDKINGTASGTTTSVPVTAPPKPTRAAG